MPPNSKSCMADAFAPVGLMIDEWRAELPAGKRMDLPVVVINDLYQDWNGKVRLRILRAGKRVSELTQPCQVTALGQTRLSFPCMIPAEAGEYQLEAVLVRGGAKPVRSLRDFTVTPSAYAAGQAPNSVFAK